jgi:hypothetical protein
MSDSIEDLQQAIHDTNEIITEISLSLVFVSSKLTLTRQKVIYETRTVFGRILIKTLTVDQITNVTASVGPVFGIIYFSHTAKDFPPQAGIFWRSDVIRMKRIIDGYVLAFQQKINTEGVAVNDLIPMLSRLGTDDPSVKR